MRLLKSISKGKKLLIITSFAMLLNIIIECSINGSPFLNNSPSVNQVIVGISIVILSIIFFISIVIYIIENWN